MMSVGEYPCQTHTLTDFLVVDYPAAYNVVIGRLALKKLKLITSIYHLMMKFPTLHGTGFIEGSQAKVRKCYSNSIVKASKKTRDIMMVQKYPPDNIEEVVDPHNLEEDKRTKLVEECEEIEVDENDMSKVLKIRQGLK